MTEDEIKAVWEEGFLCVVTDDPSGKKTRRYLQSAVMTTMPPHPTTCSWGGALKRNSWIRLTN
jgi:hypothetical protein